MISSGVYAEPSGLLGLPGMKNLDPFPPVKVARPLRVLIFGSRDWVAYDLIRRDMWYLLQHVGDYITVHGAARGADTHADLFTQTQGWPVEPHPADWKKHGKAAGPIRNQEMLDTGIDLAMGYILNNSTGSVDMRSRLSRADVPTKTTRIETLIDYGFPEGV